LILPREIYCCDYVIDVIYGLELMLRLWQKLLFDLKFLDFEFLDPEFVPVHLLE